MADRSAPKRHERYLQALESLGKPLAWERRDGFRDAIAQGGLSRYAERWLQQARETAPDPAAEPDLLALEAACAAYSPASPTERAGMLDAIEAALRRLFGAAEERQADWRQVARLRDEGLASRARADLRAALDAPLQALPGVRGRIAQAFAKLEVNTVYDLLTLFPRKHQDRRNPTPVASLANEGVDGILVIVGAPPSARKARRVTIVTAPAYDSTGSLVLTWFNQPWLADKLQRGVRIYASGKVERFGRDVRMNVDEYEIIGSEPDPLQVGRIVPVYPLTEGLVQPTARRIVSAAVEGYAHGDFDPVPEPVRRKRGLLSHDLALRSIHFPASEEEHEEARVSLAYAELLALQVEVSRRKREMTSGVAPIVRPRVSVLEELEGCLPFPLTGAQRRVIKQILRDMATPSPMSRLLHGDVGSGKTVAIMAALLAVARAGMQAAVMVPTEILAQQHFASLSQVLLPLGVTIELLIGGLPAGRKKEARARIGSGEASVAVGTHALVQEGVEFRSLALGVVDEQHRFGVTHRSRLFQKGDSPHFLVVTATPIPRTLALTVYGHLEVSVLDELPPGRQPIVTKLAGPKAAYDMVRRELNKGRQAYVIAPLIEKSEALDCQAAEELARRLAAEDLAGYSVDLLHGRVPPDQRDEVMGAFVRGERQVLVSTTVVEVGVDVPNATAMVIENAERFGLAQLHQLRGRVGRGSERSFCALVCGKRTAEARERLNVLCQTNDGFKIAMEDLRIRGPGEFFGVRQSGLPDLRIADPLADVALLELAREDAESVVKADPELADPSHADLAEEIRRRAARKVGRALLG